MRRSRLQPDYDEAHFNLGSVLADLGDLAGAENELRTVIRLKPNSDAACLSLGSVLEAANKFDAAEAAYRKGAGQPDESFAEARHLGRRLRRSSARRRPSKKCAVATSGGAAIRLAVLLSAVGARHRVDGCARHAAACPRRATTTPPMRPNRLVLPSSARVQVLRHRGSALRLGTPGRPEAGRRPAACTRLHRGLLLPWPVAGWGTTTQWPMLPGRPSCGSQALGWLRDELAAWSEVLAGGKSESRSTAPATIAHWKDDADLAGLRDATALAKLPEPEQRAFRALWSDVEAMLARPG